MFDDKVIHPLVFEYPIDITALPAAAGFHRFEISSFIRGVHRNHAGPKRS
jgi:hypothetical protein